MPTTLTETPKVMTRQVGTYTINDGPLLTLFATGGLASYGATCTRITYSNPEWRTKIAKRQDASSAYLVERQSVESGRATCTTYSKQGSNTYRGNGLRISGGVLPNSFPSTNASLRDLALTRLKRKLKRQIGSADALAPTVELRELRGLFRQVTVMTTDMMKVMIDIKRTKGKSALKYASNAWLAYNFGVSPLVDDISNVANSIFTYLARGNIGIRQSASAKMTWTSSYVDHETTGGTYGAYLNHDTILHHTLSYRWYCGGAAELLAGNDYSVWRHLGITRGDLIPAFWELVPYSWVVDYFTTVGTFLEDVFWINPANMLYSGYTRRYECRAFSDIYFRPWPDFSVSQRKGLSKFKRFEFERVPSGTVLPHVGLRLKSIDEVGRNGVTKLLNLASVFIQRKL